MAPNVVSSDDLFAVCGHQYGYPEPVARVLSKVLFWSQFAEHQLGGQLGFFKTDAELAGELRKHPKTVGRLLREVCAPAEIEKRGTVFRTRYAPKPWHPSGRVRWLYRTELGDAIIDAAKAHAMGRLSRKTGKQNAATDRREMHRSASPKRCDRSPQNVATYIEQKDSSESHSDSLSSGEAERETPNSHNEKEVRGGIERLVRLWKTVCEELKRPELVWRPSEVRQWSSRLNTFIKERGLTEMSDENLMARLRVLVRDFEFIKDRMGRAFERYNADGLLIESFARFSTMVGCGDNTCGRS
jgi:hypothetical protein